MTAINLPKFQESLEAQKTVNQKNLVIVKNDLISKDLNIEKFGLPVLFLSESEISSNKIKAYLRFSKIDIKKNIGEIEIEYAIQGLEYYSKYKLENCNWILLDKKFSEH